ncbi:MAG: sigma 54-interacting transcriptional regulator [Myxococcota bacterium]
MSSEAGDSELVRLRQERDLYKRLLTLSTEDAMESFLREALALIVDVTGARTGYLELRDGDAADAFSMANGYDEEEIEQVRAAISRGILAQALASNQTVVTHSAQLDPRFRDRGSVKAKAIEAVLCAPIGVDPVLGAIYLGAPARPGFAKEDVDRIETLAEHLAPPAERLLRRLREGSHGDPTARVREKLRCESVIGKSPALAEALNQAALVAPLDVNVLITGDSGTGKNQLARIIHDNGPRASRPFVELNCAALPEELIENELFGARAGAHSTAREEVPGKVGASEGGTLFLDEIGEMPIGAQAKLLQLLQSREYYPLGASEPVRADVRVIAATNGDLREAVERKQFREDLLYRLEVIPIRMPSLAERSQDVTELARAFCTQACERHGLPRLDFSVGALHALQSAEWPGNVRQLAHASEAAAIRAAGEGARQVERRHVFPDDAAPEEEPEAPSYQEATRRFQRELLQQNLEDTGWNIAETARRLDLARSHVYNLVKALGLERKRD